MSKVHVSFLLLGAFLGYCWDGILDYLRMVWRQLMCE